MIGDIIAFFVNRKILSLLQPISSISFYNDNLIDSYFFDAKTGYCDYLDGSVLRTFIYLLEGN